MLDELVRCLFQALSKMTILQRRPRQELAAASFFGVCGRRGHTAIPNWYLDFRFTRLRCLVCQTSLHTPDAPHSHYRKASVSGERSVMPQAFLAKMQLCLKRDASGILLLNIDGTPSA